MLVPLSPLPYPTSPLSQVGDQTLAFRLMGTDMYTHMSRTVAPTAAVARGIALLQMARLLTCSLAGEAALSFIGNEWGHAPARSKGRLREAVSGHHRLVRLHRTA